MQMILMWSLKVTAKGLYHFPCGVVIYICYFALPSIVACSVYCDYSVFTSSGLINKATLFRSNCLSHVLIM
jgi:hypothetical protein